MPFNVHRGLEEFLLHRTILLSNIADIVHALQTIASISDNMAHIAHFKRLS